MTSKAATLLQDLNASQLFRGIGDEQLQPVLRLCKEVAVGKGTSICVQGEPARFLFIVRRGRAALEMTLERPDGSATHATTVASIGPGDAFGWSAVVAPHVFTLSAQAVEDCDLILIEGSKLRAALNRYRDVGYLVMVNLAELLADRLMRTRESFVFERDWAFEEKQGCPAKGPRRRKPKAG